MFAQFAGAISCAQFSDLNALSSTVWKAHHAGHLDDGEAQQLAEQIDARKPKRAAPPTSFRPAVKLKRQRSPNRQASIERRRELARRSPVPPEHVREFSVAEHAAITIMVDQIRRHGVCSLYMDAIAALAGTCRTIVRNATRKARALGLLYREERRCRGQKSLTNLVRVLSRSWAVWIKMVGRKNLSTTTHIYNKTRRGDAVDGPFEEKGAAPTGAASGLPG